jgi:TldD protein
MHAARALPVLLLAVLSCTGHGGSRPGAGPPRRSFPTHPAHLELGHPTPPADAAPAPLLGIMRDELDRSLRELGSRATPPPYFLAYEITDRRAFSVGASFGALGAPGDQHVRVLDVDLRVGDHHRDNTHPRRGKSPFSRRPTVTTAQIPLDDNPVALRQEMWLITDYAYLGAAEALAAARGAARVEAEEEDPSDDFSSESPVTVLEEPAVLVVDRDAWGGRLRKLSAIFLEYPELLTSSVSLEVTAETRYIVTSEGARVQVGRTHARITIEATARADDGMELARFENIDVATAAGLPDDALIEAKIRSVATDLVALRKAPLAEPYTGPAILEGRAAAVYFHEVFGHRVEGHRQKDEDEGQTFAKKIGQTIAADFIRVHDDATAATLNGVELNGFYRVDDQAVLSRDVPIIEGGVLRGFLMSRSPLHGFAASNGHGRRQAGETIVARQGNLIVEPARAVSRDDLTAQLIEEVKRQGKPYGLRFVDIEGGYTNTSRADVQAFKVIPVVVYRVYPDGHEELVRGVDLEGTPLASLATILAAADTYEVFNGFCGAESGWVPVSAASPALLVGQVEVARKSQAHDTPPVLPPPPPAAREVAP